MMYDEGITFGNSFTYPPAQWQTHIVYWYYASCPVCGYGAFCPNGVLPVHSCIPCDRAEELYR